MSEPHGVPAVSKFRYRRAPQLFRIGVFAAVIGLSTWAHLYGLANEGIDDVDSAALYRMLTHRLPAHDLSYFGGYTDGVSMPAYLWGRYSYLLTLWAESLVFTPTVYRVYLHNAILGILISVLLYRTANRFIRNGAGPFAGVVFALGSLPLFYTRHLKDFAFTLFFLALGMHLLCAAWRHRRGRTFLFAGLALGVAATANYAVIPTIIVILGVAGLAALLDLIRRKRPARELARQHAALLGGLLLVVLAVEAFEPIAAYYFPFWEIPPTWGYLKGMMAHKASAAPHVGSYLHAKGVLFYIELFWREGFAVALPAVAGLILSLVRREYRTRCALLFVAVLVLPIALYSLSGSVASLARNALPSYLGFAVAAGVGYRELAFRIARLAKRAMPHLSPTLARNTAHATLLVVAIAFALPGARASMAPRSAAELIHRVVGVDRACITAPDEFAYHWTWYYFREPKLACRTWPEVADHFLNDRAEYLVTLPERYTRAKNSLLAQWTGPALIEVNDRFDFAIGGPAKAYDLHEPSLIRQLGLGATTTLIPSRALDATACRRDGLAELLASPQAGIDISVPGDGVLELRGRAQMGAPGSLLVLAVGTREEPARYYLEVMPPRLPNKYLDGRRPWTSIQACFRVREQCDIRVTLAHIASGEGDLQPLRIEEFSAIHYAGECALATPKIEIGSDVDRSVEYDAIVARMVGEYPWALFSGDAAWTRWGPQSAESVSFSKELGLTIENLGHTVLQPAGIMWTFKAGAYRPGAVYRVSFRGRTNRMQEGEVDLVVARGEKEAPIVRKRLSFWKPWWRAYSFDFIAPPDGGQSISILFREARAPRRFGRVEAADISVMEHVGGGTSMQSPDDEIDFREGQ